MRLIVTDVTEMHGGNYCVAGWDNQANGMVRPLPMGANWTIALLQQFGILPGITIDVVPIARHQNGVYPHRSEDTYIDAGQISIANAQPVNWLSANSPPVAGSVGQAFENHVTHSGQWNNALTGVYVPEGTQIRSLSATRLALNQIQLFQNEYNGKSSLRAYVNDGLHCYNLPVVARDLREAFRCGGVAAARQLLPMHGDVHVRLGLARAWAGQPGKCYLMVNGIYG